MSKSRHSRAIHDEPPPRRQPKPISARAEIDQQLDELADLLTGLLTAGTAPGTTAEPVLVYSSGGARVRHYDTDGCSAPYANALS